MLSLLSRRISSSSKIHRQVASTIVASAPPQQSTTTRMYHENIVEHYENPRNVGSLDKNDDSVGTVCFCCCCCFYNELSRLFIYKILLVVCDTHPTYFTCFMTNLFYVVLHINIFLCRD
jgi:hypothetical protein